MALEAAAKVARDAGYAAHILGDRIEGEAREVGKVFGGIARHVALQGRAVRPALRAAVRRRNHRDGARRTDAAGAMWNSCFRSAWRSAALPGIYALAGDTDGVDGMEEIAGAYLDARQPRPRPRERNRPARGLDANDGHGFFEALGDSVVTGPTLTNVNDFRAILIDKAE